MLIVAQTINIHLTGSMKVNSLLNVLQTFNMTQTACTSAFAPCHVNRLNVFVLLRDSLNESVEHQALFS